MAIFDDLGKKVTQMGQEAVAKAKNMTDQAKLHGQLNEEEKKVADNYRKIGELFYSVRGKENLPEYQTLMDEIDASKEKIADLKHQIQVAKGVMVCPDCGAEVSANASFCPNCGTRMPKTEPEAAKSEDESAESEEEDTVADTQEVPGKEDAVADAQEELEEEDTVTDAQEDPEEETAEVEEQETPEEEEA